MEVTPLCLYFSNCFTLHKQYSSMYAFICIDAYKSIQHIIYNVKTLLERANARVTSKKWDGVDGYPLDCYDYY